jgi:WD40 repeat protein
VRDIDGSPPVKLADGSANALSPDGKWAIGVSDDDQMLFVVPTGPGGPKYLPRGSIESYDRVAWLPDQKRIVFSANERYREWRCFVQDIDGGLPRPITPEGVETHTITKLLVTPDGRYVTAEGPDRIVALYSVDGGPPRSIAGILPDEEPIQWSRDEHSLYVRDSGHVPAKVHRLDLASGRRELWREIGPSDPTGVDRVYKVFMTRDASTYVYTYRRLLSELYLVEGLQ